MSSNIIISLLLLLFLNISFFPSISGLNQEGLSLHSWLSTFNSSSSFSSWNPTHQDPCNWDYIKCHANGFVSQITITSINLPTTFPTVFFSFNFLTALVLSDTNLTGEIPSSIGNLSSSLLTFDLSFNALTGKIPKDIGKLSRLQQLSLNSNFLEGGIPAEIGNCSKLQRLEFFDNELFGKIPPEIGQLWSLQFLRAGGNPGIYGEIPVQIGNCRGLALLGLADTGISGRIPHTIGELKNLKTLAIYTANLTGEIPPEIGNCSSLENFFVYENQISGEIPAEMGMLKNMKRVLLWQNHLTGNVPGAIGNCSSLVVIDFSLNSLNGPIPPSLANLGALEELLLSDNEISGEIPAFFGEFSRMRQLELDNNIISGAIPPAIGKLKELELFFAWQNRLRGSIPFELADCEKLQALDLSHNFLNGSVPTSIFNLKNLTKLLLISNQLSGGIPPHIGNCTSLTRLRLGSNNFTGHIPPEIGFLPRLIFLELSENRLVGEIPSEIGNCTKLEMVDFHENNIQGTIPTSFESLVELNVLDLSMNKISGTIPENLGKLASLNKLMLAGNNITASVPKSLGFCKDLQFLDLSSNRINGPIPDEIGQLQTLDIVLNLSSNLLTGPIPEGLSNLSKLANLDLSNNLLTGSLRPLGNLNNLVSLNVSYNNFSGLLPNTKFFQDLPLTAFLGNQELCINASECSISKHLLYNSRRSIRNLTIVIVSIIVTATAMTIVGALIIRARGQRLGKNDDEEDGMEWNITPFQKLNFSVYDIVKNLSDSRIVGKGCSGVVYRVETPMQQVIAVKKLLPVKKGELPERDMFTAEVTALGSIRHKNIVRLLGCCDKGRTRLLLFDYISNGSLAGLLHEKKVFLDWDARYNIILGAAHGLAYLHHDCIPRIVHRDIKANNILVGPQFEAFLADFGLAKLINSLDFSRTSTVAGSYGYIAPEYGYSMRITEKSDVYSYGIVVLEVLTGMEPTDHRIPDGAHIVRWINLELREKHREFGSILDQQLLQRSGTQMQEMLQVLGVALLCVNPCPEDRPTMKDVSAMLKEIRDEHEDDEHTKFHSKGGVPDPRAALQCSSFSNSSEALIRSPS